MILFPPPWNKSEAPDRPNHKTSALPPLPPTSPSFIHHSFIQTFHFCFCGPSCAEHDRSRWGKTPPRPSLTGAEEAFSVVHRGLARQCVHSSGGHWAPLGTGRDGGKEAQTRSPGPLSPATSGRAPSPTRTVSLIAAREGRRPTSSTSPPGWLTAPRTLCVPTTAAVGPEGAGSKGPTRQGAL